MACSPGVTRFFSFVPALRRKIETRPSAMRRRPSPGDETTQRPSRSAHSSSEWWRTTALRRSKRSSEPLPSAHHPPLRSSRAPLRWLMLERPSAPSSGRSARPAAMTMCRNLLAPANCWRKFVSTCNSDIGVRLLLGRRWPCQLFSDTSPTPPCHYTGGTARTVLPLIPVRGGRRTKAKRFADDAQNFLDFPRCTGRRRGDTVADAAPYTPDGFRRACGGIGHLPDA